MDRMEAAALGAALIGHAALLALLTLGLARMGSPTPTPVPMEVSFVDEVGLVSAAPEPAVAPPAAGMAPDVGPAEDAPSPRSAAPTPAPAPSPPLPTLRPSLSPRPALRQAAPAPTARPGTAGAGERTRRSLLGNDLLKGIGRDPTPSRETRPAAATMSRQAAADIGSAIARQVQPCADRQVYPGPGAERIVTPIALRLNRDGSLAGAPRVGRQRGLDDENRRYAQRVADIAIAAFTGCSPLRGLPAELYDVPRGWSNFTMNYRLPG